MQRWNYIVGAAAVAAVATAGTLAVTNGGDGPAAAVVPPDTSVPGDSGTVTAGDRTIVVSGHGTVQVTPDIANVSMGVQANAETSQEAMDTLSTKSNALVDTLTALGIAAEDIQTSGLSLWPTYSSNGTTINGYQASTSVNVTVRDIGQVGAIVDAAAGFVGNELTLSGISFSYDDPETVLQQARAAAVDNARVRAEQYADAAGVELGDIVRIVESSASEAIPVARMEAAGAADASVAIAPGSQDLAADVSVVFSIG
jgi:uncharacterized protein YggE